MCLVLVVEQVRHIALGALVSTSLSGSWRRVSTSHHDSLELPELPDTPDVVFVFDVLQYFPSQQYSVAGFCLFSFCFHGRYKPLGHENKRQTFFWLDSTISGSG